MNIATTSRAFETAENSMDPPGCVASQGSGSTGDQIGGQVCQLWNRPVMPVYRDKEQDFTGQISWIFGQKKEDFIRDRFFHMFKRWDVTMNSWDFFSMKTMDFSQPNVEIYPLVI